MTPRLIAAVSGVYDGLVGVVLLTAQPLLSRLFGVPLPDPPIHADLNGVFLLAVALGYAIPYRDPDSRSGRAYLWIMGPFLKGGGAATFLIDHLVRQSPRSFLVFAASDAILALLTLWALMGARRSGVSSATISSR